MPTPHARILGVFVHHAADLQRLVESIIHNRVAICFSCGKPATGTHWVNPWQYYPTCGNCESHTGRKAGRCTAHVTFLRVRPREANWWLNKETAWRDRAFLLPEQVNDLGTIYLPP